MLDFINDNLFPLNKVTLIDRRKLGPYKYDRAEMFAVVCPPGFDNGTRLNKELHRFCSNQSNIREFGNDENRHLFS